MKVIAKNKKAFFDYEIIDSYECGIQLKGTEVKSIKEGRISLKEAFVRVLSNEIYLINAHVPEYLQGNQFNHEPTRSRKLLMHRKEIDRLMGKIKEKGLTLVPLKVYLKNRLVKVEIGLGKGKKAHDKRQIIKDRENKREMARAIKNSM
jgi:SsrA-binding protein